MLWIGDSDFEVRTLLIALKFHQILSKNHLHGLYSGLMETHLGVEVDSKVVAVMLREGHRSSNVKIVEKVCDVQKDRMTSLEQD